MKYINVSNRKPINIGRRGEESVTTVRFSINAFFPHMPSSATYGLIHQRHNDAAPYPCTIAVADGYINWVIGSGDLANVGNGTAQLSAYLDGAVAKTVIFTTVTTDSMGATNPPDPQQIWIDEVINAATRAEQAAIAAKDIRDSIEPEIVWTAYGQLTSAQLDALYQAGKLVAFKSTSGNGLTYFLTKRVNATTHWFTAVNETQIRCVRVVNNTWFDTDVYNLTTEEDVSSYVGSKASNNTPADLAVTPSAGISNQFSRADHVHKMPSAEDVGAYVKPAGGIPKTDLVSAVQTSLGKADSAYQKPSGGIPKTDLASAVQTSLDKADTALQTAPVTSVNGETGDVVLDIPNIDPDAKTSDMTQSVGVDSSGKLWTAPGGGGSVTVDDALSDSSTNPVQNKVVKAAVDAKYTKPSSGIPASDLAAGVIPDAEVFWATYGTTTTAEIFAAYNAHKIIICKFNGRFYQLVHVTGQSQFEFSYAYENYIHNLVAYGTNSWTDNSYQLATQGAVDAKITAPSSPATGAFLVWSGSAWTAQTLATWQGGNY